MSLGGFFDVENKEKRLAEIAHAEQDPGLWGDQEAMKKISKEKSILEKSVKDWTSLKTRIEDSEVMVQMLEEEPDESEFENLKLDVKSMIDLSEELELGSLLSGPTDSNSCYLSINSGAGGTEACDWAQILCRMFTRYGERQGFKVEVVSMTEHEEAGLKSVTLLIEGPFAYGYLKAETGVHRLVRISPFDSNARRHTSFASVFTWPEVDDDIEIEIKDEEIRIDTYRASGAGGQHINKTDSAVRITHEPTGVVVQCQNQRSQHANKDRAFKMLKSALYELELEKRQQEKDEASAGKKANEWGSQIRSYVLHPYQMIKDHRTNFESSKTSDILDGELSGFVRSYLTMNNKGSQDV